MEIDWIDLKRYGPPDEPGNYLCAFSDNAIETMSYDGPDDEFWSDGFIFAKGAVLTHWCVIEDSWHPDYDPSPENQEDVTRIGGWG